MGSTKGKWSVQLGGLAAVGFALLSVTAMAGDTEILKLDGLKSGSRSWGLAFRGCPVASVSADGKALVKGKDGAFLSTDRAGISKDARVEVEVADFCNKVEISELKVDQLSLDSEDLPTAPPTPGEVPAAQAAKPPANQEAAARIPAPSAPEAPLAPGQEQIAPGQPAPANGMMVNLPGRVLTNAHNQTVTGPVVGGNVNRDTDIFDNIGADIRVRENGGSKSRQHITMKKPDTRIPAKGAKGGGGTDAYAGHSHVQSGNQNMAFGKVGGNVTTRLRITGNIGGSVDYESNDGSESDITASMGGPDPVPVTNNKYVTQQTTTRVLIAQPSWKWNGYYWIWSY